MSLKQGSKMILVIDYKVRKHVLWGIRQEIEKF